MDKPRPSLLRRLLLGLLALVLLFEEWGWEPLQAALARLGRLPIFATLERWVRSLPPWAALALYVLPALALLPAKLLALWLIGHQHALLGLGSLLAAKALGTAVLARLFTLTQPALMKLEWFARLYPRWKAWKDELLAQVRASPAWLATGRLVADVRRQWRLWLRGRDGSA